MAVVVTQTANPGGDAASASTLEWTGVSIGSAAADRIVCVCYGAENTSATPNSATIDYGSGDTAMNASPLGVENNMKAKIFWLPVPTGTTATIKISVDSNIAATTNHIAVYSVTGASATLYGEGSDSSIDMDATNPLTTGSITIPTDGAILLVAAGSADTVTKTWTNATEDISADGGVHRFMTATAGAGTVTITCQGSTNGEDGAMSWLIFSPGTTDHSLTANGIKSTGIVGKPALTQDHAATANGIKSTGVVGKPALTQDHALTASGVKSEGTVGAPALSVNHELGDASGVKSTGIVGKPALSQDHVVVAAGIKSQSTVGAPALTQDHALTASGVTSTGRVAAPALSQDHALTATGVHATGIVASPVLTQDHVVTAEGVKSTGIVGAPALTVDASSTSLEALGIKSTIIVGSPAMTQDHAMVPLSITATGTVGSPAITSPEVEWRPGGSFGMGPQAVGDTRWEGVRQARADARAAFEDLPATRVAARKKAVVRASEAVEKVARKVREQAPRIDTPVPTLDPVVDQLDALLAELAGLMEQERIRAEEARAVAEMWAMIDRELRAMAEEEELMMVLALAL